MAEKKKSTTAQKKTAGSAKKTTTPKSPAKAKTASKTKSSKGTTRRTVKKRSKKSTASAGKKVRKTTQNALQQTGALLQTPPTQTMEKIMTQSKNQYEKISQDAANMSRDNIEAFVKSGTIFAKGCEELMRTSMSLAQESAEKQAKLIKQAMSCKSLNEWTEVQNKLAQANFDDFMSSAGKISEMSAKMLNECVEPISDQMNRAVNKASKSMAA